MPVNNMILQEMYGMYAIGSRPEQHYASLKFDPSVKKLIDAKKVIISEPKHIPEGLNALTLEKIINDLSVLCDDNAIALQTVMFGSGHNGYEILVALRKTEEEKFDLIITQSMYNHADFIKKPYYMVIKSLDALPQIAPVQYNEKKINMIYIDDKGVEKKAMACTLGLLADVYNLCDQIYGGKEIKTTADFAAALHGLHSGEPINMKPIMERGNAAIKAANDNEATNAAAQDESYEGPSGAGGGGFAP